MSHLFVALPLPDWIRHHLQSRSQAVKKEFSFQKWSHPEDYHLTLFFYGETNQRQDEIITLLEQVVTRPEIRCFSLRIDQWSIFGREEQPRVLWAGVKGEQDRLFTLQSIIRQTMNQAGFPSDRRPFRPHITIAKKGKQPNFSLSRLQSQYALENHIWTVRHMVLYRTHLQSSPHYREVAQFPFKFKN